MNRNAIMLGGAVLALALVTPVMGYHINPEVVVAGTLTSGDFVINPTSNIIVCESDGAFDDLNDNAVPLNGQNGLCYTGENGATGVLPPTGIPDPMEVIRIDACDATVFQRQNGVSPAPGINADNVAEPEVSAGEECADATGGGANTNNIYWTFSLGVFTCDIPHASVAGAGTAGGPHPGQLTDPTTSPIGVDEFADFSAYYKRLYGWWSWDAYDGSFGGERSGAVGDGWYTEDFLEDGAPNNDANPGVNRDAAAAHRGHVAMFIDTGLTSPGVTQGSAETYLYAMHPFDDLGNWMTDSAEYDAAGLETVTTNSCGGSPACPPDGVGGSGGDGRLTNDGSECMDMYGPVVRAPHEWGNN